MCNFARLSMRLDDHWHLGYWESGMGGPVPNGPCEACGRRAAWLTVGGLEDDEGPSPDSDYLELHPAHVCGWCFLAPFPRIENRDEYDRRLAGAGERSIEWRWRWSPYVEPSSVGCAPHRRS